MNKFVFILFGFFIVGCNANESFIYPLKPEFEAMSFDVVEKKIIVEQELPNHVQKLLFQWFNQRVKIDGFDGDMSLIVSDFNQDITSIEDGKRVDVSLAFEVIINKPSLSYKKFIEGNISSFGTITGNFNLKELDTVIENTQSDLILRLSKDLKSKI